MLRRPDAEGDLCQKLREHDEETCSRYLETQAMWWRAFGAGRCVIVGDAAAGKAQGFVVDAFETVLRLHQPSLSALDVGNTTRAGQRQRNVRCATMAACVAAAEAGGCTGDDALVSLGRERELGSLNSGRRLPVRSLVDDVYQWRLGVFGGPPTRLG